MTDGSNRRPQVTLGLRRILIALFVVSLLCLLAGLFGDSRIRNSSELNVICANNYPIPETVEQFAYPYRIEFFEQPLYGYKCVFHGIDGQDVVTDHLSWGVTLLVNGGLAAVIVSGGGLGILAIARARSRSKQTH